MPKQLFQCDKCGLVHTTKPLAVACEKKHKTPDRIEYNYDRADKKNEYPSTVKMWFGTVCVEYTRKV